MPDKEKEVAGLPIGGVFVILAILLGYFIVPDQPFKSSRQPIPDTAKSQALKSAYVEARLWEDPFAPFLRSKSDGIPGAAESGLSSLTTHITEKIPKNSDEPLVVLGVMVFGGEYAENTEMRRRSRYAVLSALAEKDFFPDRPDRLEYLDLRGGDLWQLLETNSLPVIPYEFFSGPRPVVVLWLNEDLLGANPLKNLGMLAACLRGAVNEKTELASSCRRMKLKILGPAGSTTLQTMIEESTLPDTEETSYFFPSPCEVEIFSWAATADENFLPQGKVKSALPQVVGKRLPVRFYRTIGTDGQLMEALVAELKLRGVEFTDHVALISEWDTIYGRNLPKTFARYAANEFDSKNIHRFTYMRGIDGQISKTNEGEKAPEPSSQGSKKGSRPEGIEKPMGNSQFDYLRRLSLDLKKIDVEHRKTGGSIKAIGVLGSDIYDKLLVLQAMYELFPRAIFFTTDLDARFLHPDELQWTRNLVIASSFGLRLHLGIQKNTPPFRDSYQTALFFTTHLALNPNLADRDIADCASVILQPPRIFEVGRSDAFELYPKTETAGDTSNRCDWLKPILHNSSSDSPSIHPELRKGYFPITPLKALWLIALAVFFLFMIYAIAVLGWNVGKDTILRLRIVIGALICLSAIGGILWAVVDGQIRGGEPFGLLEGISIWPTVYLRVVACMTAIGLIFTACWHSRRLERKLLKYFEHAKSPSREPAAAAPCGDNTSVDCAQNLWEAYRHHNSPGQRLIRVVCLAIPYSLLCGTIIFAFGLPFVPFRGDTSQTADRVSLAMAVISFIVLLFWVVDATSAAVWFIKQIQNGLSGGTEKAESRTAQRFGITVEDSREWIGVKVVTQLTEIVNKFIYYPILVIILLGISRLSYFDRWDMPPGLLLVILLGLGFSISCAIRLRRRAEQFRERVLARLWMEQVRLAGDGNESKGLFKKIDLMINHIKSIRSGAFVPFIEQPWVRATLIFITSGGGLTALQYLPWFQ